MLGLQACEEAFNYMLELRLEDDPEMNQTVQQEVKNKLSLVREHFQYINIVILSSETDYLFNTEQKSLMKWDGPPLSDKNNSYIDFSIEGKEVKAFVREFPFWDWHIVSYVYKTDYTEPIRQAYLITYLSTTIVFVSTIITLLVVYIFFINRPLKSLISATNSVSEGEFRRVQVIPKSELGYLTHSFNSMVSNLEKEKNEVQSLITQLQESSAMLRLVLDNIPVRVFWKDLDLKYRGGNQFFAEDAGLDHYEQLIGKTDFDLDFARQADKYRSDDRSVIEEGASKLLYEEEQDRPDGTTSWVQTNKVPMRGEDGKIIGLLGTYQDITSQKKAEEEVRQLRNYLSNIIDSMPSVLVGINNNLIVTLWNKEAEKRTGISRFDSIGKKITQVFPDYWINLEMIELTLKNKQEYILRKQQRKKDNQNIYENHTIFPLIIDGLEGAVIRIDDATKEVILENQLNQSRKLEAIGSLAGGVAHDFNNMLGGIIGSAELLLLQGDKPEKVKQYTNIIIESSARAADLTSKLLAFSRQQHKTSTAIDVHKIIDETISLLENTVDKRVSIKKDLTAEAHVIVGDPAQIQNAILNLGINASQAMPHGGQLSIRSNNVTLDSVYCESSVFDLSPGNYIKIEIRDTGVGISIDIQDRIFDPFFTTKEKGKGTGLGLAAVYGSIKQHSGAITVYSEINAGTVFRIILPLSDQEVDYDQSPHELLTGSGSILVVDDEEVMRISAKSILNELGYDTTLAVNGEEALELYRKERFDAVLLDMIMPVMNGKDCFEKLRKIDPDVRVILASGFSREQDVQVMKSMGLREFIQKPYRITELSQKLHDVLAQS